MNEKVAKYDRVDITCGSVVVHIESIQDLRTHIASRPQHSTLALENFDAAPFAHSRLDYNYDSTEQTTSISGFIELNDIDGRTLSTDAIMNNLYEYLLTEAEVNDSDITESYANETLVLSVDMDHATSINFAYDIDDEAPRLYMYTGYSHSLDDNEEYEVVANCLQMWGELHEYLAWTSQADRDNREQCHIVVKRASQSDAAFMLWQALCDYDSWRKEMGTFNLPTVDYKTIDIASIGASLDTLGRDYYDYVFPSIRALAINLRKHKISKISTGELIVGLTS